MGCLNSAGKFAHWFGNIHLSGPCNRSCYFCIGQHMMALDSLNNLDKWPLDSLDSFVSECKWRGVQEVYLTGSNTDPLLYHYLHALKKYLYGHGFQFGVRTNGALFTEEHAMLFDKVAVSLTSLDEDLSQWTMGGSPPDIWKILRLVPELKVNIVLCPETAKGDLYATLMTLARMGVQRVNLREPYGQPHVGNPMRRFSFWCYGMPATDLETMEVVYWDVHYVEVESVNLYANGRISTDYPITRGHDPSGEVKSQEHFSAGRQREQWKKC